MNTLGKIAAAMAVIAVAVAVAVAVAGVVYIFCTIFG
jgi:hypothetical protein